MPRSQQADDREGQHQDYREGNLTHYNHWPWKDHLDDDEDRLLCIHDKSMHEFDTQREFLIRLRKEMRNTAHADLITVEMARQKQARQQVAFQRLIIQNRATGRARIAARKRETWHASAESRKAKRTPDVVEKVTPA